LPDELGEEIVGRISITYEFVTGTVTDLGVTNAPRPPDVTRGMRYGGLIYDLGVNSVDGSTVALAVH